LRSETAILLAAFVLLGPACSPTCSLFTPAAKVNKAPIGDTCVVGRWVDQLTDDSGDWTFNNEPVRVTGMQGFAATFSTDGTEVLDWSDSQPLIGTYHGRELKIMLSGSYTFHGVTAARGRITRPAGTGSFAASFDLGGVPQATVSAHVDAGWVNYTCSATTLHWLASGAQPASTTFTRG
jgi:hypothetical protein